MTGVLSVDAAEVRRLVRVVGTTGDVFFFVEELLQLHVGFLDERGGLGLGLDPAGGARHDPARLAGLAGRLADRHRRLADDLVVGHRLVGEDVALVEPHLHADTTRRRPRLAEPVVDVGAQRVQRHPTLAVPLGAAHLGTAEAARALHLDAERAGALGVLHGALHGPAEGDAVGQLVGHTLGDQGGIELGVLDLDDVELDLWVAGDLGDQRAQLVGLGAAATDHDARAGGVDVDADLVTRALDLDAADRGGLHAPHDRLPDLPVLGEVILVLALGEPAALPVGGDAEPVPVRVDLLVPQLCCSSSAAAGLWSSASASASASIASADSAGSSNSWETSP